MRFIKRCIRRCINIFFGLYAMIFKKPKFADDNKNILVIDYQPEYYAHAGGRARWHMLLILKELGYNIHFMPIDWCNTPVTKELRENGINHLDKISRLGYFRKQFAKKFGKNYDYIWYCRPDSYKLLPCIEYFVNAKKVYDVADLHFMRLKAQYEINKLPQTLQEYEKSKALETEIFGKFDHIVTVSAKEVEIIKGIVPNKTVSQVPAYSNKPADEVSYEFDKRKNLLFVGSLVHNPNEDAVRYFRDEILPLLDNSITLDIVGSNWQTKKDEYECENIRVLGFLSEKELDEAYANTRIAIMPLRFGGGTKGKTLEAMSLKLPIVSSSFGIEGIVGIDKYYKAFDTAKEFAQEINSLYFDKDKCEKYSQNSYECAKEKVSLGTAKEIYNNILIK